MKVAINIYPLESSHKNRGVGNYTRNLINSLEKYTDLEIIRFKDELKLKDIDVFHYPWFDLFFRTLPLRIKNPTVITVHDVIPLVFSRQHPFGIRGRINFYLQLLSLKKCRVVITDSETSKGDIQKFLKISSDKIKVVTPSCSENFRVISGAQSLKIKTKYKLPDRFILYVGDANYTKNLPFLIKGFFNLKKKPELADIRLVLVGGVFLKKLENIEHPELASLKEVSRLIKEYNLKDQIIIPGQIPTEDLVGIYNLATTYVQPSLYEGFGLSVLEALSCAAPVLCSRAGSLPGIAGNAAVYFDPNNLGQFTSSASDVLEDRALQKKLSNLGLKQATKFSGEIFAKEMEQIYCGVIKND